MNDKTERNKQIYEDRNNGMKYADIADKHKLSSARVREIYRKVKTKEEQSVNNKIEEYVSDETIIDNNKYVINVTDILNNCIDKINNSTNFVPYVKDLISELSKFVTDYEINYEEIINKSVFAEFDNGNLTFNQIHEKYNISKLKVNKIYKLYNYIKRVEKILSDSNVNKEDFECAELGKLLKYNYKLVSDLRRNFYGRNIKDVEQLLTLYLEYGEKTLNTILKLQPNKYKEVIRCIKEYEQEDGSIIKEIKEKEETIKRIDREVKIKRLQLEELLKYNIASKIVLAKNNINSMDDLFKLADEEIVEMFKPYPTYISGAKYVIECIQEYKEKNN